MTVRIYVPRDAAAIALGAHEVAADVANEIDLWSLANEIDVGDIAREVSMSDLAQEVVEALDLDDLASRCILPPRTLERVERLEERLAMLEEAEPVAAPAPATVAPAALPVTGDVLDAVLGRTVDALLAALNAAAAEGRL